MACRIRDTERASGLRSTSTSADSTSALILLLLQDAVLLSWRPFGKAADKVQDRFADTCPKVSIISLRARGAIAASLGGVQACRGPRVRAVRGSSGFWSSFGKAADTSGLKCGPPSPPPPP